jgi:hypothetical protein
MDTEEGMFKALCDMDPFALKKLLNAVHNPAYDPDHDREEVSGLAIAVGNSFMGRRAGALMRKSSMTFSPSIMIGMATNLLRAKKVRIGGYEDDFKWILNYYVDSLISETTSERQELLKMLDRLDDDTTNLEYSGEFTSAWYTLVQHIKVDEITNASEMTNKEGDREMREKEIDQLVTGVLKNKGLKFLMGVLIEADGSTNDGVEGDTYVFKTFIELKKGDIFIDDDTDLLFEVIEHDIEEPLDRRCAWVIAKVDLTQYRDGLAYASQVKNALIRKERDHKQAQAVEALLGSNTEALPSPPQSLIAKGEGDDKQT